MSEHEHEQYALLQDGAAVDYQPRTAAGALTANNRGAWYSRHGGPCEILRPDGSLLARWVRGVRADLDGRVARVARHM